MAPLCRACLPGNRYQVDNGYRLYVEEDTMGALNLYSTQPNAFDEDTARIGSVLAAHAAVAWQTAPSRENLEEALKTREVIGQAKGMLMERHRISGDAAFEQLVKMSQDHNVKLQRLQRASSAESDPTDRRGPLVCSAVWLGDT